MVIPPDEVARKLEATKFAYVHLNEAAIEVIESRVADSARIEGLITYGELVQDVDFRTPRQTFQIARTGFTPFNRRFIGNLLGEVSRRTYISSRFFASALVVNKGSRRPNSSFFEWARTLGALSSLSAQDVDDFWHEQRRLAQRYYKKWSVADSAIRRAIPGFLLCRADGQITPRGHRLTLQDVLLPYRDGYTADMLASQYPTLPLALIHRIIAFYLDNEQLVERYLQEQVSREARNAADAGVGIAVEELRRRRTPGTRVG